LLSSCVRDVEVVVEAAAEGGDVVKLVGSITDTGRRPNSRGLNGRGEQRCALSALLPEPFSDSWTIPQASEPLGIFRQFNSRI
jgi:hypothetical protein